MSAELKICTQRTKFAFVETLCFMNAWIKVVEQGANSVMGAGKSFVVALDCTLNTPRAIPAFFFIDNTGRKPSLKR